MVHNKAYSHPFAFVDSQPQIENTGFDPRLVEAADVKPGDMES